MTNVLSVLILEDNQSTATQLMESIRSDPRLSLAGCCHTLTDAQTWLANGGHADAALIDLELPDGSGIDFIRTCAALPSPPCALVMTVFADEKHVLDAIEAGALGYLLKERDSNYVAESIITAHNGGSPISPSIARQLLRRFQEPQAPEKKLSTLTSREEEVLRMVVKGFSYKEIAHALSLSKHTVTSHIQHIYRKLSVRSRGEAVFEAIQLGLVDLK